MATGVGTVNDKSILMEALLLSISTGASTEFSIGSLTSDVESLFEVFSETDGSWTGRVKWTARLGFGLRIGTVVGFADFETFASIVVLSWVKPEKASGTELSRGGSPARARIVFVTSLSSGDASKSASTPSIFARISS